MSKQHEMIRVLQATANYYAPCGPKAIEDGLRKLCADGDHKVHDLRVTAGADRGQVVRLDLAYAGGVVEKLVFEVRNPNAEPADWEACLDWIKRCQEKLPAHLAGEPHNAGQTLTRRVKKALRRVTGYEIGMGDFWVHVSASTSECTFGALTQTGTIVMHYLEDHPEDVAKVGKELGALPPWE